MIVADTNLIAQLVLKLDQTEQARLTYRRDPDWRMPDLWRHEFLNVLANYLRFDKVSLSTLLPVWQRASHLFDGSTCKVDKARALALSGERNISAYDAQYLALAQALGAPLITEDRRLLRAAPLEALTIKQFLASRS